MRCYKIIDLHLMNIAMEELVKKGGVMEDLIKKDGVLNVDRVVASWNDRYSMFQWREKYRLLVQPQLYKPEAERLDISEAQARDIIHRLKLLPIENSFFISAVTWRSQGSVAYLARMISYASKDSSAVDIDMAEIIVGAELEFKSALACPVPR